MATLGLSAVKQVLIYAKKTYTPEEEAKLINNIEESAKKQDISLLCYKIKYSYLFRFDPSGRGELTDKEIFNVLKIMNKIDITQDQVFAILEHLPRNRNGKIRVDEFISLPIISEDAFKAIDRNKDGFLSRGELKMTNRSATMGEVGELIEDHDQNYDKKLNILEYRDFLEEEVEEELLERSKNPNISKEDDKELQRLRDFLNSE